MAAMIEAIARTDRHTTFYLAEAPRAGHRSFSSRLAELSLSWRHQLRASARSASGPSRPTCGATADPPSIRATGLRGGARRARHARPARCAGRDRAIWVGHDWGGPRRLGPGQPPPERCTARPTVRAVLRAGLRAADVVPLVDRSVYPRPSTPRASGTTSSSTRRASSARAPPSRPTCWARSRRCSGRVVRAARGSRRGPRACGWMAVVRRVGRAPRCRSTPGCSTEEDFERVAAL